MKNIEDINKEAIKKIVANKKITEFSTGDTIKIGVKIVEGKRERIQYFEGVCIAKKNRDLNSSFTVRKISFGEGVERTFALYSPNIDSIQVIRTGKVRRAKLYYLRSRKGKSARIAEKIKKKIGIDVSTQPDIPEAKTETIPKEEIKVAEKSIEISEVDLNEANNRFESGLGNKLDLLESKTQLHRNQLRLIKKVDQYNSNLNKNEFLNLSYKNNVENLTFSPGYFTLCASKT